MRCVFLQAFYLFVKDLYSRCEKGEVLSSKRVLKVLGLISLGKEALRMGVPKIVGRIRINL